MTSQNKKFFFMFLFMFFLISINFPEEMKIRSIDSILADIRNEQGVKGNDKINPDKVSPKLLEELGDAVMEKMIGNSDRHEFMDNMMGGEGSQSLTVMHQRLGYNYLTGNIGGYGNMMGYGGMMNTYPYNNFNKYKGGYPMMWNNGFGMMGWGYTGWIIGFLFIVLSTGFIIFFALRNRGHAADTTGKETAIDILKKRYAKGEISKKEFIEMKKDL